MLNAIDFSGLEYVSAVKNISTDGYGLKLVLCTITFVESNDSISHLEGLEYTFAKLKLEEDNKFVKLAVSYTSDDDEICTDMPIKVIFNRLNNSYRNVTRTSDDDIQSILNDVKYVEQIFDRSENKLVYM